MNHNVDTSVINWNCKLNLNYGERDRHPQSHLCNTSCMSSVEQVSWTRSCKVSPGRFIPPSRKMQSTLTKDNKSINAHKTIVFYSCNQSMHRHGSDTTVGIRSIENKKFPTARTNNKPRSNQEDGSNEKIMRLTLEDSKAYEIRSRCWCSRSLAACKSA